MKKRNLLEVNKTSERTRISEECISHLLVTFPLSSHELKTIVPDDQDLQADFERRIAAEQRKIASLRDSIEEWTVRSQHVVNELTNFIRLRSQNSTSPSIAEIMSEFRIPFDLIRFNDETGEFY
jgi:hypothetical protein